MSGDHRQRAQPGRSRSRNLEVQGDREPQQGPVGHGDSRHQQTFQHGCACMQLVPKVQRRKWWRSRFNRWATAFPRTGSQLPALYRPRFAKGSPDSFMASNAKLRSW